MSHEQLLTESPTSNEFYSFVRKGFLTLTAILATSVVKVAKNFLKDLVFFLDDINDSRRVPKGFTEWLLAAGTLGGLLALMLWLRKEKKKAPEESKAEKELKVIINYTKELKGYDSGPGRFEAREVDLQGLYEGADPEEIARLLLEL
jgi:hypothetical protein